MRIQQQTLLAWGLILAWACTAAAQGPGVYSPQGGVVTADAQDAAAGEYREMAYDGPDDPGMYDPAAAYDPAAMGAAGMAPPMMYGAPGGPGMEYPAGSYPPNMQPYPGVSPFENQFSQSFVDDGLWMHNANNSGRMYKAGIDLLMVRLRRPGDARIGFPRPPQNFTEIRTYRDLSAIRDNVFTTGARVFYGWTNPDQTGFELSGMFTGQPTEFTQIPTLASGRTRYQILRYDPVNNSFDRLPFDGQMTTYFDAQVWGAEANWMTMPILGSGSNRMRVLYGVRYNGLREGLEIRATDSITGITTIDTRVMSQFVGPQVGLTWELGGDKLKITTFGKLAVAANIESVEIVANNYGLLSGEDNRMSTHLSPIMEFGINAEMPLFGYLPIFKKIPVIRDGIFRAGYGWTGFFLTQRPADTINYYAPLPTIDTDRSTWYYYGGNLGIEWKW